MADFAFQTSTMDITNPLVEGGDKGELLFLYSILKRNTIFYQYMQRG